MADQDVAIPIGKTNAVAALADQHAFEDRLHGLDHLDSVGFDVRALDLDVLNRW